MKKNILILLIILFNLAFYSCKKSEIPATENEQINLFIWRGLNTYYLWQNKVSDLSDNRFSYKSQVYNYFKGYPSPKDVFESLLYQKDVIDRFSWIVDDYIALENSFQGITLNSGMEFGLVRYASNPSSVFGYVRYVIPNSDAEFKGITRGMIFNTVDGTQITEDNFRELLFNNSSNYTIGFANYNNGNPTSNGIEISLIKSQLQENPIAIAKVITEGVHKIGYLLYNQFSSSYDEQLNNTFAYFRSEGITELIIDLRYNGGGSVSTTTYLASMITGQFTGEIFSKQIWNQKIMDVIEADRFNNLFTNKIATGSTNININSLQMTKVYFIVSNRSASASELIINGLKPYVDVKLVGKQTYGKYVGSVTLYDSDDFSRNGENLNPNHTWAMQPIVLEIKNKLNENQPQGIIPEIDLAENYGNLGVLGEVSDPLLARTITYITTGARISTTPSIELEEISDSKIVLPTSNNMYIHFPKDNFNKKFINIIIE